MKHIVSFFLLCASLTAHADKKYGLGFVLGDPTALSFKYNQNRERAFDVQLAFSTSDFLLVYGDYLVKFPGIFKSSDEFIQQLTPYVGVGPVAVFASKKDHRKSNYFDNRDDRFAMALRIPFGIEWMWDKFPIGIGLEIAPGIVVLPSTDGFLHGGLTFRYYF